MKSDLNTERSRWQPRHASKGGTTQQALYNSVQLSHSAPLTAQHRVKNMVNSVILHAAHNYGDLETGTTNQVWTMFIWALLHENLKESTCQLNKNWQLFLPSLQRFFFCVHWDERVISSSWWLPESPLSTVVGQLVPRVWCLLGCLQSKTVGTRSPGMGRSVECAKRFAS